MNRGDVEHLSNKLDDVADDAEGLVAGATPSQVTILNSVVRSIRSQRDAMKKLAYQVGRGDIEQRIQAAQQELADLDKEIGKL